MYIPVVKGWISYIPEARPLDSRERGGNSGRVLVGASPSILLVSGGMEGLR